MLRERAFESMLQEFGQRVSVHHAAGLKREQARLRRDASQAAKAQRKRSTKLGELKQGWHMSHLDLLAEVPVIRMSTGLERHDAVDRGGVHLDESSEDGHLVPYAEITVGEQCQWVCWSGTAGRLIEIDHLGCIV